jgi:hypothetical protein
MTIPSGGSVLHFHKCSLCGKPSPCYAACNLPAMSIAACDKCLKEEHGEVGA